MYDKLLFKPGEKRSLNDGVEVAAAKTLEMKISSLLLKLGDGNREIEICFELCKKEKVKAAVKVHIPLSPPKKWPKYIRKTHIGTWETDKA